MNSIFAHGNFFPTVENSLADKLHAGWLQGSLVTEL